MHELYELKEQLIDELKEYFTKYVTKRSIEGFIEKVKNAHLAPFTVDTTLGQPCYITLPFKGNQTLKLIFPPPFLILYHTQLTLVK